MIGSDNMKKVTTRDWQDIRARYQIRSIRVAMVAKVNCILCPMLVIIMTVVPTRQPSQSIGGLTMQQGLASDQWLLYIWSPHLVAYYIEKDLHPILSDTSSSTSASIEKMNACMDPNLQLQTGLPGTSEIALNDKGGESLDKDTIFSSQGTVPSWNKASTL